MSVEDSIDIINKHPRRKINHRKFLAAARPVLSVLREDGYVSARTSIPVEVSVVFTDDRRIRQLKKKYFGIDRATDVVAFPQKDRQQATGSRQQGEDIKASKQLSRFPVVLGDIVISLDHAKRQAKENGHSYSDEVLYLFIHGMLHLMGFRDAPESEAALMFVKQNKIWDTVKNGDVRAEGGAKKSGHRADAHRQDCL